MNKRQRGDSSSTSSEDRKRKKKIFSISEINKNSVQQKKLFSSKSVTNFGNAIKSGKTPSEALTNLNKVLNSTTFKKNFGLSKNIKFGARLTDRENSLTIDLVNAKAARTRNKHGQFVVRLGDLLEESIVITSDSGDKMDNSKSTEKIHVMEQENPPAMELENQQLKKKIAEMETHILNLTGEISQLNANLSKLLEIQNEKSINPTPNLITTSALIHDNNTQNEIQTSQRPAPNDEQKSNMTETTKPAKIIGTTKNNEGNERDDTLNTNSEAINQTEKRDSNTFKKNKKIPPFLVMAKSNIELRNQIKVKLGTELTYNIEAAGNENGCLKWLINCADMEAYDAISAYLIEKNYPFNTYAARDNFKPCYLIKNIYANIENEQDFQLELDDIHQQIMEMGFQPISTSWYTTKKQKDNNMLPSMIRIILPPNTNTTSFEQIKYLHNCRVYIEKFKPNQITQCKNCQRTNHTASFCHYNYRCVKCIENHGPGECKIDVNKHMHPQCVNCGKNHVASSYDCEIIKEALARKAEKKSVDEKILNSNQTKTTENINKAKRDGMPGKGDLLTKILSFISENREQIKNIMSIFNENG